MIRDLIPILEGGLFLVVLEALVSSGSDRVGGIWTTISNAVAKIVDPSAPAIAAAAAGKAAAAAPPATAAASAPSDGPPGAPPPPPPVAGAPGTIAGGGGLTGSIAGGQVT